MRIRPWPIVLLAVAHILAPFANILYSAWLRHAGLGFYLRSTILHGDMTGNALYLLGFPIAGVAIYKTNRWSYPVFLAVMAAILYWNFLTWRHFPQYFGLSELLLSYAINLGVVSYFLIPQVRNVYFNPRLRWWESKPRYDVELPTRVTMGELQTNGVIQNISEGGVYLDSTMIALLGNEVELGFSSQGSEFRVAGRVVHVREAEPRGYGIQFLHTPETARALKENIRLVRKSGARERTGNASLWQEFKSWFVTAVSTGKGLVPPRADRSTPKEKGAAKP